ncbi:amidohydrolase [Actinokineospora sp. NBRC 105648]|uniref:amidohydrolase n=1 Tax=Actinokineospora sp. NBRC 105648 TaxID=3032206 RepID=UPI0024A4156B|nr:amidohydrolase [Actinokineospora sp. NBRC 105648]GLZ42287.1 amidase [Actinokineospora sp. NBRC 105648]
MTPSPSPPALPIKDRIRAAVADEWDALRGISDFLHGHPEVAFAEHQAARVLGEYLGGRGFAVTAGAYGLPTAFEAVHGDGEFTVVICAEYDALPGLGHACGHNLIAAAAVGAGAALAPLAAELSLRVKVLGTPAEESGGGKVAMLARGAWDDAAFSIMVHPTTGTDIDAARVQSHALERIETRYAGRAAHAASAPHRGVNAGDAATVALVAIGLLRQQLPDTVRMSAYTHHGGDATNIIPAAAALRSEVRALTLAERDDARTRMLDCLRSGAVATGCTLNHESMEPPYEPLVQDERLARLWNENLAALDRVPERRAAVSIGSTDMGNVSQVVPSLHPLIAILGHSAPGHSAEFAASANSEQAALALRDAATAMAWTVADVAADPGLRARFGAARERRADTKVGEP